MTTRMLHYVLLAGLALAATGCLSMAAPDRFLITHKGSGEIQAVAADDSRLLVREFNDEHGGELSYWIETLRKEFTDNRGYTLIGERPVQDARGRHGWEGLFEVTMGGATWCYLLTVSVREGFGSRKVRCVEFVAEKDAFDEHLDAVREAAAGIDP